MARQIPSRLVLCCSALALAGSGCTQAIEPLFPTVEERTPAESDKAIDDDGWGNGTDDWDNGGDDGSGSDDTDDSGSDDGPTDEEEETSAAVSPGAVVITEFLANAEGEDSGKEWLELHNMTEVPLNLQYWTLSDLGADLVTIQSSLILPAHGYIVLGQSTDPSVNGAAPVSYSYDVDTFKLGNGDDEVVLSSPTGEEIDRVEYGDGVTFPSGSGAALSLDPSATAAWSNDSGTNWCMAPTVAFGSNGDLGSPGQPNPSCSEDGGDTDGGSTDGGSTDGGSNDGGSSSTGTPVAPGAVVITEVLNNPAGDDTDKEWFEILNLSSDAVDMNGWTISDLGADSHTVAGLVLQPGDYAVLGSSAASSLNGGVAVDYAYGTDINLANGDDELVLTTADGTVIDEVIWDGGPVFPDPNGTSLSLTPSAYAADSNDDGGMWCESSAAAFGGNGDLGTPGAANPICVSLPETGGETGNETGGETDGETGSGTGSETGSENGNGSVSCSASESEPNGTASTATTLNGLLCGSLAQMQDVDTYRITLNTWDTVVIDVDAQTLGSSMDGFLTLMDSGGAVITTNDDENGTDPLIEYTALEPGTYYVSVMDYYGQGGADYSYEISTSVSNPCSFTEFEPNGLGILADLGYPGETACGTVSWAFDYDYYTVWADAGTIIGFEVEAWGLGSTLGAQATLYEDEPGGFGDPSVSWVVPSDGFYFVEVTADLVFINDLGPYQLHIN